MLLLIALLNPLTPLLLSGHSDAQPWAPKCPDVKNYKWRLNPVWHRVLHSCTHMATVGVKWLTFTAELLSTAVHEKFATILCLSSKTNIPLRGDVHPHNLGLIDANDFSCLTIYFPITCSSSRLYTHADYISETRRSLIVTWAIVDEIS